MLTIDEVARRLNGERHGDGYMCSCPLSGHAHGDQKRSLSVTVGRNGGILMHCHVHGDARIEDFAKAMGLEVKDFMPEDGAPAAGRKEPKPWKEFREGDRDKNGFVTTVVYIYENADGTVGMRKCRKQRTRPDGGYDKTFLMQAPKDGKWWKPSDIGSDAVHLLYHLPEVLRAIREGRTVYIAEGEKDVDNLRALGFTATCSATGGGKGSLSGKFTDGQAAQLDGADVVLIPDNDEAGEGYVRWIAEKLYQRGTRCRIARLTDDMPDLPEKGDFTDWAQILKKEGVGKKELLARFNALVEKAPVYEGAGLEVYTAADGSLTGDIRSGETPPPGSAGDGNGGGDDYPAYHGSNRFCVVNGHLHKRVQNGTRELASFVPEPGTLIRRDDGMELTQSYAIGGTLPDGTQLPEMIIRNVKDFLGPTWSVDLWGYDAGISSQRGAPAEVFEAIVWAGRDKRTKKGTRTIYTHAGIRTVNGRPCYLYNGGAVGQDDVAVELGGNLERSDLSEARNADGTPVTRQEAAWAERVLLDAYPPRVILPLLAQAFLAPVYSQLEKLNRRPAYVVYLDGKTNAGKSTAAGYAAAHFGAFSGQAMPAGFDDTQAGMRDKLFIAKDMLLVVDDYRRQVGDGGKKSAKDALADLVISSIADRSGRSRENADRSMERERPPRCTCIMTGELLPNISVSRRTRIYRITVDFGELIVPAETHDTLQDYMERGLFRQSMRHFILDLLSRWDALPDELRERHRRATEESRRLVTRAEGRYREMAAHLLMGAELLFDHLIAGGAMTVEEKAARLREFGTQISLSLTKQGVEKDEALPEQRWLEAVRALYGSGTLRLYDKRKPETGQPLIELDGFLNGDVAELIASRIEAQVGEILRKGQRTLEAADYQDIYRALAKRGMLLYKEAADGSIGSCKINTKFKGKQMSCLKLKMWALSGDTEEEANRTGAEDMTETDEDSPF